MLAALPPDVRFTPAAPDVGFVHRRLPFADVYFVANTSNVTVRASAAFRVERRSAEVWDPMTGRGLAGAPAAAVTPGRSRCRSRSSRTRHGLWCSPIGCPAPQLRSRVAALPAPLSLAEKWNVRFPDESQPRAMESLRSWTEDASRRYFSGVATYEQDVAVPAALVRPGVGVRLDFGEPRAVPPEDLTNGMRAWIDAPVREAAVVWVNGTRVGSVWCPPYAIDVTGALRAGTNRLRIDVANLAINGLAGRPLPSYRLLNARYGTRFEPQDMDKVQPEPSGLLGKLRLVPFQR